MDPPPLQLPQPAIPLLTALASAAEHIEQMPLQSEPEVTRTRSQERYIYGTAKQKLPPPPTRHRTIIHQSVKTSSSTSGPSPHKPRSNSSSSSSSSASSPSSPAVGATMGPGPGNGGVSKPHTTAAERKHARKLAHSDIERRRRNKINEQFDSLKSLIPACSQFKSSSGGDVGLHKLVILQHAVEYITHLKTCLDSVQRSPPLSPPPDRESKIMSQHNPMAVSTTMTAAAATSGNLSPLNISPNAVPYSPSLSETDARSKLDILCTAASVSASSSPVLMPVQSEGKEATRMSISSLLS